MLKKKLLLTACATLPFQAFSDEAMSYSENWSEGSENFAFTATAIENEVSSAMMGGAEIYHENSGKQAIAILLISGDPAHPCASDSPSRTTTMKINGQPVRMYQACQDSSDYGLDTQLKMLMVAATAVSTAGADFIKDAFLSSTEPVDVELGTLKFSVPVDGFAASWASSGGDAL